MEKQADKPRRGRKPMPDYLKKKTLSTVVEPEIFLALSEDIKIGKAESHGQRIAQILKMYYARKNKS